MIGPLSRSLTPDRQGIRSGLRSVLGAVVTLSLPLAAAALVTLAPAPPLSPRHVASAQGARPQIVAHRGGSDLSPENTLPAFADALRTGVDQLELDVRYTRDHVLVVHHDAALTAPQCVGPYAGWRIQDLTFAQVRAEDCGHGTEPGVRSVAGTQVPTLDEVYDLLDEAGDARTKVQVEIKRSPIDRSGTVAEFVRDIGSTLTRHGAQSRTILTSFDWHALAAASSATAFRGVRIMALASAQSLGLDDDSRTWFTGVRIRSAPYHGNIAAAARAIAHADDLSVAMQPWVSKTFIGQAHRAGMRVALWTLNSPSTITQGLALAPDAIVTDNPRLLRSVLSGRGMSLPSGQVAPTAARAAVPNWSASPRAAIAYAGADGVVRTSGATGTGRASLGGHAIGSPAVSSNDGDRYVVVRAADHRLWVRTQSTAWTLLTPGSGRCWSDPATTVSAGQLLVSCLGPHRTVQVARAVLGRSGKNPVAGRWSSLGGTAATAPTLWTDRGVVRAGIVAPNGRLYTRSLGGRWGATPLRCGARADALAVQGTTVVACKDLTGSRLVLRVGTTTVRIGSVRGPVAIADAGDVQVRVVVQGRDNGLFAVLADRHHVSSFARVSGAIRGITGISAG